MRETWNATRVGVMVTLGLIAAFLVYRYVNERASDSGEYTIFARFEDVQGLIEKSRVMVAGIPVGNIGSIRLDNGRARVDLVIEASVPIYRDGSIESKVVSVLGERALVINPGSANAGPIPNGGEIRVRAEAVTTNDVMIVVDEIAGNVAAVTAQMERAFGTDIAGARMEATLRELSEAMAAMNRIVQANEDNITRSMDNIEKITDDTAPRMVRILDNIELATRNLSQIINNKRPDIERTAGEVDDTVVAIGDAAKELQKVLEDVHVVTERTAAGEGTVGRLTKDEALINEMESAARGVSGLLGGFGRLRTLLEIRSEYNFMLQSFKTYFSVYLVPREGRYFLIQLIDDPRGALDITETIVTRSPPIAGEPPVYVETLRRRTNKLRFSAQIAKRVKFATFRIGIMESTGGLGADLHFFRDRLEINTDLFAFNEQVWPRLRVRFQGEIVRRFWFVAGLGDALNGRPDIFAGLMLRFDDQDLKGLLPFAGGLAGN